MDKDIKAVWGFLRFLTIIIILQGIAILLLAIKS